jgi:Lrp/AsnC family transcriptional regulator for asnA, asnC and gidA
VGGAPVTRDGRRIAGIEWDIISSLREDGRISNREIARRLGVSEGTIRAHVKRLEEQGLMKISAVTMLGALRMRAAAQVGVFVEEGRAREVADALAAIPEMTFVAITFGQFDIIAIPLVETREELLNLLSDRIAAIPGVRRTETIEILRNVKHDFSHQRLR